MITKKLELIFDDGNFGAGEFKIFSVKEIEEFPKDLDMYSNIAVIVFNQNDLEDYNNDKFEVDDDDYRFVISASPDGKYIEVLDFTYLYIKKNLKSGSIYLYDPCGELDGKWNQLSYEKK
jgi:hypothetical protein